MTHRLVERVTAETTGGNRVGCKGSADVVVEVVARRAVGAVQVGWHLRLRAVGIERALLDT